MYLLDTNVVSEARKGTRAAPGVRAFLKGIAERNEAAHLSGVAVGELRRGVELIRHRGDEAQAKRLDAWLGRLPDEHGDRILDFDAEAAQVWGRLRVPRLEHALDKQIAAIALVNDLTVVTRNVSDFAGMPVRCANPFAGGGR